MEEEEEPLVPDFEATPETKDKDGTSYEGTELGETEGKEKMNKEEKLLKVAETGNIKDIEKLVKEDGINLKCTDINGQTALHLAAKSLHTAVCETLVNSDKSLLKIQDKKGNLPLHLSISSGKSSTKLVDFFLANEANPKTLTRKKQTSLHIASEKGNCNIVKLFIDKCVPIGDEDSEKFTALHLAAKNGHTKCCEDLFKAGAEINVKSKQEQTPLQLAAKMRFSNCCKFLLESGADVNIQDKDGNTALHLVCSMRTNKGTYECLKCITLLLEKNADPNIVNKQGETALQAAKKAPTHVLNEFMNTNINVTQTNIKGQTILHSIACRKEANLCEEILNICRRQEEEVTKFVNQQDNTKFTALHYAIKAKNSESCKALVKAGADGNICNSHGNALHMVADFGNEDICDFLITKGIKIDVVNSNTKTALQIAAHKGHTKICKLLLNKNPNVMLTDSDGNSALHLAALGGHVQCCQLLADKNQLSLKQVNNEGKIPLHVAAFEGKHDCCEVLINNRSEIWKMDKEGHSAAYYAYQQKHDSIFLLLLNYQITCHIERDMDFKKIFRSAIEEKRRIVCEGLIKSEFWEEVLKTENDPEEKKSKSLEEGLQEESTIDSQNFRNIINAYPDLAKFILDKCQIKDLNKEGTISTYNFAYIDDTIPNYKTNEGPRTIGGFFKSLIFGWCNINASWQADHPVTLMRKKPDLLNHSVITQWMQYKWKDYGRWLYYSYICLLLVQFYLLLLYFIKSWTWTTLLNNHQLNQTVVCPEGPRIVGPEVERLTIENNKFASHIGYILLTFSIIMFISYIYKSIKIPSTLIQFKTVLVLLTGICNIILVINFTQCSRNTHLREDIQWLSGYASSGFLLLTLILTFGEHPNSSKIFFDLNTACQGVTWTNLMSLLIVISLPSIYYPFSENIENVMNMEPPKLWIILILLISIVILVSNTCNRTVYIRIRQRRLAFISLIMDHDVLFPPLRNWSYRKSIIIDQEYRNCLSLNTRIHSPQDEDEAYEENAFEKSLTERFSKIEEQLESISLKMNAKNEC